MLSILSTLVVEPSRSSRSRQPSRGDPGSLTGRRYFGWVATSALLLGAGLGIFWRAAGFPSGTFVPGLAGHGPDPQLWPRLLFLWVPAGHVLFSVAYVLLARWNPGVSLRGHARADQGALLLVPLLLVGLLWAGPAGPWRGVVGAWYVTAIAVRSGILLHALWRCLAAAPPALPGAGRAAFATLAVPYVLLVGSVGTTSTSGDEPYYLLIAHSLVHDGDLDPDNNIAAGDYVGFYWGRLAAGAAVNAAGRAVHPRDFYSHVHDFISEGFATARAIVAADSRESAGTEDTLLRASPVTSRAREG